MEKESKKKPVTLVEGQEHGNEDDKVEKFFAIVRRLRDARNCASSSLRQLEARRATKKTKKIHVPAWTPSFQPEDFAEPGVSQLSCSKKEPEEKKEELNLNLTL
ncbi:hypothetical protein Tsubulata_007832 [Turnera subulata]|uniref:Uncharacterized protein n=1 Tax=Turnera subulata TaxID=218843 RepID=A0A9Q0FDE7_9ROSI|nr:hypothetical protein Tsubulata_007832 [Turnera subulata]